MLHVRLSRLGCVSRKRDQVNPSGCTITTALGRAQHVRPHPHVLEHSANIQCGPHDWILEGQECGHSLDRTGPEKPAQAGSKKRSENVAHIGGRGNGWVVMSYTEILRNERLEPEALIQPLILRET